MIKKYILAAAFIFTTSCFGEDAASQAKQYVDLVHHCACVFSKLNYQEAKSEFTKYSVCLSCAGDEICAEIEKQMKAAHWKKMARDAVLTEIQAIYYIFFKNLQLEGLLLLRSGKQFDEKALNRAVIATKREFSGKSPNMVAAAIKKANQFLNQLNKMK